MSRRKDNSLDVLPGFEGTVIPCRPGEQDFSDEQRFTGEVLFRDHPGVFRAVAAAFFMDGLSIRACAARHRVSVNTVRAIRDMALESATTEAGRAAFFIKSKADRLKGLIHTRALEAIYDRLTNHATVSAIPVDTLIRIVEMHGSDTQTTSKQGSAGSGEVIDVEEFDDVLNGLDGEKNSAQVQPNETPAENPGENTENPAAESGCESSTENDLVPNHSLEESNNTQCLRASNKTLCNTLCKGGENDVQPEQSSAQPEGSCASCREPPAPKDPLPIGAGGTPGASAAGGVN